MRLGMLGSLVLHTAMVVAIWGVTMNGAPVDRPNGTALMVNADLPPAPEPDPPPPLDPPPPPDPDEPPLPDEPEELEPLDLAPLDDLPEPPPERTCAPPLIRLRTPLPGRKVPQMAVSPPVRRTVRRPAPRRKPIVRKPGPVLPPVKIESRCGLPAYPDRARRAGFEGDTVLRLKVSKEGAVLATEVLRSSGYAVLDRAAAKCASTWRFEPARQDGRPVEAWFPVRFSFSLDA